MFSPVVDALARLASSARLLVARLLCSLFPSRILFKVCHVDVYY